MRGRGGGARAAGAGSGGGGRGEGGGGRGQGGGGRRGGAVRGDRPPRGRVELVGEGVWVRRAGAPLWLTPEGALWWPGAQTLVVADVHLGKSASFRALGLPVPGGELEEDLGRLAALVARHEARRLLVLGDLVHAAAGLDRAVVGEVAAWREGLGAELWLVPGNHDAHVEALPRSWGVFVTGEVLDEGPWRFVHAAEAGDPDGDEGGDEDERVGRAAADVGLGGSGQGRPREGARAGEGARPVEGVGVAGRVEAGSPSPAAGRSPRPYLLSGHRHPGVTLGRGRDAATFPCFHLGPRAGVLPAFGSFTGTAAVRLGADDEAWVIVPARAAGRTCPTPPSAPSGGRVLRSGS